MRRSHTNQLRHVYAWFVVKIGYPCSIFNLLKVCLFLMGFYDRAITSYDYCLLSSCHGSAKLMRHKNLITREWKKSAMIFIFSASLTSSVLSRVGKESIIMTRKRCYPCTHLIA